MVWIIVLVVAYFIINLMLVLFFANDFKMAVLLFFLGILLVFIIAVMNTWDDWHHSEEEGW